MFSCFQEGRTAIHYAALNGHQDVVKVLVADGCDIDCKDKVSIICLGCIMVLTDTTLNKYYYSGVVIP